MLSQKVGKEEKTRHQILIRERVKKIKYNKGDIRRKKEKRERKKIMQKKNEEGEEKEKENDNDEDMENKE